MPGAIYLLQNAATMHCCLTAAAWFTLALCLRFPILLQSQVVSLADEIDRVVEQNPNYRGATSTTFNDAVSCAYMFAQSVGDNDASYEQFAKDDRLAAQRRPDVVQLNDALCAHGVEAEIRTVSATELRSLLPPYIVLLSRDGEEQFCIVAGYNADVDRYDVIDGSTAAFARIRGAELDRGFSGSAITTTMASARSGLAIVSLMLSIVAALELLVLLAVLAALVRSAIRAKSIFRNVSC